MGTKVLHVIESISSGGVEKRRLLMAKYLGNGFEQKVICTTTKGPIAQIMQDYGVEVIPLGKFLSIFSIRHYVRILTILRTYQPHIIHGAVFEGVTMAAICGFLGRVPTIVLEETSDPQNRRWTGNLLLRVLSWVADYVVAISPSVERYLVSNGVKSSKIRVIPNGVDRPSEVSTAQIKSLKKSLEIADDKFVIGTVGRLRDYHKRVSDLIKAVAIVKETIPVILLVVGDGPDRQSLEKLARDLGVESLVRFAGYQYETAPYYACMDLFSLASQMEGFGLVVVEAMLCNVPVVVTNVGGMRDIVHDSKTGVLVKPFSPEGFASCWVELYNNEPKRARLAEAAFEDATLNYTSDAYISKLRSLYREIEATLN